MRNPRSAAGEVGVFLNLVERMIGQHKILDPEFDSKSAFLGI